jgi:hypothetical protein
VRAILICPMVAEKDDSASVVPDALGAVAAAVIAAPGTRLLVGLAALVPHVAKRLGAAWSDRREKRRTAFLFAYLEGCDVEDEELAEAELFALADDPNTRELVFDAFRVIDDAMIEQAVVVMGRLTRHYRVNAIRADWFSRGVRKIMVDVSAEDYAALKELLAALDDVHSDDDHAKVALPPNGTDTTITVAYNKGGTSNGWKTHQMRCSMPCAMRAFELLKSSMLAREASGQHQRLYDRPQMRIAPSVARGLLSLMP